MINKAKGLHLVWLTTKLTCKYIKYNQQSVMSIQGSASRETELYREPRKKIHIYMVNSFSVKAPNQAQWGQEVSSLNATGATV
jgi:hypothetical protein